MFEFVLGFLVLVLPQRRKPRTETEWQQDVIKVYHSVADPNNRFSMASSEHCIIGHARLVGVELFPRRSRQWHAIFSQVLASRRQAEAMLLWLANQSPDVTADQIERKWRWLPLQIVISRLRRPFTRRS